jgi:hypothetical protein
VLMRGLDPGSDWTHLLPGMIVAGVGAGLVSVPLASTAVSVVAPARAGMASGINTTFRQVGIATGVAGLGAILAARLRDSVVSGLAGTPLAGHAHAIADRVSSGDIAQAVASVPPSMRATVAHTTQAGFVDGLNSILLVGALLAFGAAVLTAALIRQQDFVSAETEGVAPAAAPA